MLVTIDIGKEWTVLKKASANRAYRLATVDTAQREYGEVRTFRLITRAATSAAAASTGPTSMPWDGYREAITLDKS